MLGYLISHVILSQKGGKLLQFFIVKDKCGAAEPKGRGKKHCALLQIFSKVTLTLFLFCTLTDPLA